MSGGPPDMDTVHAFELRYGTILLVSKHAAFNATEAIQRGTGVADMWAMACRKTEECALPRVDATVEDLFADPGAEMVAYCDGSSVHVHVETMKQHAFEYFGLR